MDDSVDILSPEALQSLGLDPDFLDVSHMTGQTLTILSINSLYHHPTSIQTF